MSKQRTLINPPEIHPAPGFSHVAFKEGSTLVCIAGQVALAEDFSVIGPGDLAEQTRVVMRNIEIALRAAGATWDDVIRRTIYTLHPTEFGVITKAIESVQNSEQHPAQTIVGTTGLAVEGLLIEIEVTAVLTSQASPQRYDSVS